MRRPSIADLRGLNRLAIDTAREMTDLVEEMHYIIAAGPRRFERSAPVRMGGVAGLAYRGVRGYYTLVGSGVEAILGRLAPRVDDPPSTRQRESVLAALNGVLGDYLAATHNPLAIEMSLRSGGQSLSLEPDTIRAALPRASGKLVVLVHGLCGSDLGWTRRDHDHGLALQRDLGYTPVYVHYNSGSHVSTNGRQLAAQLEVLVREWPQPVDELVLIGHSMGGLLVRSACHYGELEGHGWRRHLRKVVFLGTPHHGSPLERIGNWTETLLGASPYTAPLRRVGTHRSAGITDLRYGNLLDEDWVGIDRFDRAPDGRRAVPLPAGVRSYAVAATVATRPGDFRERLMGDGLVPLESALGLHKDPERCLVFPQSATWVGYGMGHQDLLSRTDVYEKIREWMAS